MNRWIGGCAVIPNIYRVIYYGHSIAKAFLALPTWRCAVTIFLMDL